MKTPYKRMRELAEESGLRVPDLLGMSSNNDPFYAGRPAQLPGAQWFAEVWNAKQWGQGVHLRRLHYQLQASGSDLLPDGSIYLNDDRSSDLLNESARVARHLQLIPAHHFIDRRNTGEMLANRWDFETDPELEAPEDLYWTIKPILAGLYVPKKLPEPSVAEYRLPRQGYRLEVWIEKSTMNDVLLPLCRRLDVTLIWGMGYQSISNTVHMLQRVAQDERPTRILYISDWDSAGENMPSAVARQIEFYREQYAPEAEIQLQALALTEEQVNEYNLPRVPHKTSDRSNDSWNKRHGEGRVELDALEALHPGVLGEMVGSAIKDWHDPTLSERVDETQRDAEVETHDAWKKAIESLDADRKALRKRAKKIRKKIQKRFDKVIEEKYKERLDGLQADLEAFSEAHAETVESFLADTELPDPPEPEIDEPDTGEWLFDSDREYFEQINHYKRQRNDPIVGFRECSAPDCSNTFAGRKDKIFCSTRCRNRIYARQQRAS